jgi:hypothetical protein
MSIMNEQQLNRKNKSPFRCAEQIRARTEPSGHVERTNLRKPEQLSELKDLTGSLMRSPANAAEAMNERIQECSSMARICLHVVHEGSAHALNEVTKVLRARRKTFHLEVYMHSGSPFSAGMVPNIKGFMRYPREQHP